MTSAPPPRLYVLMRPESSVALVIRQGPSRVFCTIGWDLVHDRFEVGQWCKHTLYPERSDISPDGEWFLYFALDGRWTSEAKGAWTALSRVPYLKAVQLWPQGDTWGGGGLLYAADRVPAPHDARRREGGVPEHLRIIGGDRVSRLARDGWVRGATRKLEKPWVQGWSLRKRLVRIRLEEHALVRPDGRVVERTSWQWADVDRERERLVWAEAGKIYAARASAQEPHGEPRLLFDANPMSFEAIAAPYGA